MEVSVKFILNITMVILSGLKASLKKNVVNSVSSKVNSVHRRLARSSKTFVLFRPHNRAYFITFNLLRENILEFDLGKFACTTHNNTIA